MLEHKTAPLSFELKALGDQGEFEGYALTYGNKDDGGDICVKGCMTNSLRKRPANKVKMLWQHDPMHVIGKWSELVDDEKGLLAKGQLFMDVQKAREVFAILKGGGIDGLSIGYRAEDHEYDKATDARLLKQIDVREISVVTFAMNSEATITMVKSASDIKTKRQFEEFLRDHGFSAGAAKGIASKGFREDGCGISQDVLDAIQRNFTGLAQKIKAR